MIRRMEDSDWPAVERIYRASIDAGDSTFTTTVPSFETWDTSHLVDCRLVYVRDDNVLGFAALSRMSSAPAYCGSVGESIYVDREHRGEGIGTELLKSLITESESYGYWSLYAIIFSTNEASIHLHSKCGFRVIGTREKPAKDRFGNWMDTTLMERRSDRF